MCGHRWGKIVTIIIVGNFTKKLNDYSEWDGKLAKKYVLIIKLDASLNF